MAQLSKHTVKIPDFSGEGTGLTVMITVIAAPTTLSVLRSTIKVSKVITTRLFDLQEPWQDRKFAKPVLDTKFDAE